MNNINLIPFTKWTGGKRQLLDELKANMPKKFNTYYEPFIGGGALFFNLRPKKAIINDINSDLMRCYVAIRDNVDELIEILKNHSKNNNKEYYLKIREVDRTEQYEKMRDVERAARLMYMLRVNFNGLYRVNSKGQFNVPYGKYKNPNIVNEDLLKAINKYFNSSDIEILNIEDLDIKDQQYILSLPQQQRESALMEFTEYSSSSFADNLKLLGAINFDSPQTINIYPKDYESKEKIDSFIDDYNKSNIEDNRIIYNDLVGLMISSVSSILNVITYLLIGFVSISLIVSSIMIGIITYVSVLERTKEIGILKSIGASKRDISRVFNAETIIIGLFSGTMGILITYLLLIPANSIIGNLTGVANFTNLPINTIVILVSLSTLLTLIAGLIPARIAAKKDAVDALRTE